MLGRAVVVIGRKKCCMSIIRRAVSGVGDDMVCGFGYRVVVVFGGSCLVCVCVRFGMSVGRVILCIEVWFSGVCLHESSCGDSFRYFDEE